MLVSVTQGSGSIEYFEWYQQKTRLSLFTLVLERLGSR